MDRALLETMSSQWLHDQAMKVAKKKHDAAFLWSLLKELPAAEAAAGHMQKSKADVISLVSLLADSLSSGKGEVADALRPFFIEYLEKNS